MIRRWLLVCAMLLISAVPLLTQNARRVTTTIPPPSGSGVTVTVVPGQSIQDAITRAGIGGVVLLKAGTHRITDALVPLSNQTIMGERAADGTRLSRINGSRILTGWTPSGGRWYVGGQTQEGTLGVDNDCEPNGAFPAPGDVHWRCKYPEDVFFNCGSPSTCTMKHHEDALADVGAGEWFFDYPADRIYVGDDPTNHFVQTSVVPHTFDGFGVGVTIRGLVVELFASPNNSGTVGTGDGWLIDDNEIRWNHGAGIGMGSAYGSPRTVRARNNYLHHNCGYAVIGSGGKILFDGNELAYNNIKPQSTDWATGTCGGWVFWGVGGTKFVWSGATEGAGNTPGVIMRGNYSHHNHGPGLWADIENWGIVYENNRIEFNSREGIFHEISCQATIRNNWLTGNGTANYYPGYVVGAGINVQSSRDVEVYGNTLINNEQGITGIDDDRSGGYPIADDPLTPLVDERTIGPCQSTAGIAVNGYGAWSLVNLNVHDNYVESTGARGTSGYGRSGVMDAGTNINAWSATYNNHFEANDYFFAPIGYLGFFWADNAIDRSDVTWTATFGHDDGAGASITRESVREIPPPPTPRVLPIPWPFPRMSITRDPRDRIARGRVMNLHLR